MPCATFAHVPNVALTSRPQHLTHCAAIVQMLRATDALLHEGQVRARRSQQRIACRLIAVSLGSWLPPDYSGQLANPAHL